MKAIPSELNLTPEQAEGVRLYRELVQRRRRDGHLQRHYAEVDRLYPGLDQETRHELALSMLRKALGEKAWRNATSVKG